MVITNGSHTSYEKRACVRGVMRAHPLLMPKSPAPQSRSPTRRRWGGKRGGSDPTNPRREPPARPRQLPGEPSPDDGQLRPDQATQATVANDSVLGAKRERDEARLQSALSFLETTYGAPRHVAGSYVVRHLDLRV